MCSLTLKKDLMIGRFFYQLNPKPTAKSSSRKCLTDTAIMHGFVGLCLVESANALCSSEYMLVCIIYRCWR